MPRIYVDFDGLRQIGEQCREISDKIENLRSEFEHTVDHLDWDIRVEQDIEYRKRQISNKLDNYRNCLKTYQSTLDEISDMYIRLDNMDNQAEDIGSFKFDSIKMGDTSLADSILEMLKDNSVLMGLLSGLSGIFGSKAAGVLEKLGEYIKDLIEFNTGSMTGTEGLSHLCNLADGSVKVWDSLYQLGRKIFSDQQNYLFNPEVAKTVSFVSAGTGLLATIGTWIDAGNKIGKEEWETVAAQFTKGGKSLLSAIKDCYDAVSLSDVKSPWSPAVLYEAVGQAALSVVETGFESHEKYYQDGVWDLKDTAETGIDISLSGLYALADTITYNLDDVFFGWVADKASNGNPDTSLSYAQQAAEGYKILANDIGKTVGEWVNKLKTLI